MLEFRSFIFEKLFVIWVRTCQLLGLVLVEFDKRSDRFVLWKFSSIYCVFVGTVVTILYPIILLKFQSEMGLSFTAFSFTIFISIASYCFYFIFMTLSYIKQYKYRHELHQMLNNFVYFYRISKETYQEFNTDARLRKQQKFFFLSVLVKLVVFALDFITYFFLSLNEVTFWYTFLSFPFFVAIAICNQFFLGILIIEYFISTINLKLKACSHLVSISHPFFMSKQVELDLERLSNVHTKLYELLASLSIFFGYQMMFNIFCSFLRIAITGFQIFSVSLMIILEAPISWDFKTLIKIGTCSIFFVLVDIFMHLMICVRCSEQVRLKVESHVLVHFTELKLILGLNDS